MQAYLDFTKLSIKNSQVTILSNIISKNSFGYQGKNVIIFIFLVLGFYMDKFSFEI